MKNDLALIRDILHFHLHVLIDNDKEPDILRQIAHNFNFNHPDLEPAVQELYYWRLKLYGFINGSPPNKTDITLDGQMLYDILNIEDTEIYDLTVHLERHGLDGIPLNMLFTHLKTFIEKRSEEAYEPSTL